MLNIDKRFLLTMGRFTWFWLVIAISCLSLVGAALFYQHVLEDYPCEICIYIRVWIVAIALLSIASIAIKKWRWPRAFACLMGMILSLGLAFETWKLLVVEYAIGDGGACSMFAKFPSWAPLDKWLPAVFEVQGFCAATPEILFGFTMAHSLVLVSVLLIAAFSIALYGVFSPEHG